MPVALVVTVSPRLPGLLGPAGWRAVSSAASLAALPGAAATAAALRDDGWTVVDVPDAVAAGALTGHVVVLAAAQEFPGAVAVVDGAPEPAGARLLDVAAVMDRLRSPGGCPWDAEQTHESLATYLVEETFETLAAIDGDDPDALREELGDVLLQVAFHSRIAEESEARAWSIDDVASDLVEKLIRRHPHVFADGDAESASDVEQAWHELKQQEKPRRSVVDGVPMALPALALSEKLLSRSVKAELDLEVEEPDLPDDLDEALLGALLFGVVSAARRQGLDAETALRRYAHGFAEQARRAGLPSTGG